MAVEIDKAAFPRLHAYWKELPQGFDSHPSCLSKASIYRKLLELRPVDRSRGPLPSALVDLIERPAPIGAWVPTTLVNAIELAVADSCGSDNAFVDVAHQMNGDLLRSPMYSAMFALLSPTTMLKVATSVWSRFHQGTKLHVAFAEKSATVVLTFPPLLHPKLILLEKGTAYQSAVEVAGAKDIACRLAEVSDRHAQFRVRWS